MAKRAASAGGGVETAVDPLAVGREAARGLNKVASMADKEYRRQAESETAHEPATPEDAEFFDELDALHSHLSQLETGQGEIRMDVYLTHPLPPGFKERMYFFRVDNFRALEDLNEELARRFQQRGRWGSMQLFLHSKARDELGRWRFIPGGSRTVTIDVEKTPEAAAAAATAAAPTTTASPTVDPIAAAEKMA